MAASSKSPLVSIIIPTLNAANVLEPCLESIKNQDYPRLEILIIDAGSTDKTLQIAKKYHCNIIKNPLKTGEAGKAVGIGQARGSYICLIDSDNILPDDHWLKLMVAPLESDPDLVGSEPMSFTYRSSAGFIERYSALIGANDPYAIIAGNYDRTSYLHPSWTSLPLPITCHHRYHQVTLKPGALLPTIGANGTIYRSGFLKKYSTGDYFFDIDFLSTVINITEQPLYFAKIKTGIIHTYCESSIPKFFRKQLRRSIDMYQYRDLRQYSLVKNNWLPSLKFSLYTITILPMIYHTILGYAKFPDPAWFFHPLACVITLYAYATSSIKNFFGILTPVSRVKWSQ